MEVGLVVDDVQLAYESAVQAGCVPVKSPETKPWVLVVSYVLGAVLSMPVCRNVPTPTPQGREKRSAGRRYPILTPMASDALAAGSSESQNGTPSRHIQETAMPPPRVSRTSYDHKTPLF